MFGSIPAGLSGRLIWGSLRWRLFGQLLRLSLEFFFRSAYLKGLLLDRFNLLCDLVRLRVSILLSHDCLEPPFGILHFNRGCLQLELCHL